LWNFSACYNIRPARRLPSLLRPPILYLTVLVKEIKNLISALGFVPAGADEKVYVKRYSKHHGYKLKVDFENKKIDYGSAIKVKSQRVLGFDGNENFVVLECVNRLLTKGYEPKHLELERMFPVGHNPAAGRADITVYDRRSKALFVIECKTFGEEYEHAKRKLQNNVGQLFTYLQQDRNTRFLCLYASRLEDVNVLYENLIIRIKDSDAVLEKVSENPEFPAYVNAAEANDFHRVWREQYDSFSTPNGIFDDDVTAYNPDQVPIKRKDLKPFTEVEGRKFFNEFAEILRHNNVSDNSNAFNRILSLVLCKIVDEQKSPEKITEFQIQDAREDAEAIQDRLQRLYAEGMERFLKERIVYISKEEIEEALKSFPKQAAKDKIRKLFIQQKFYSNNEFAFKEVHNEKLFQENAKVLIEILQLLQYKEFRYDRRDSAEYKKQKRYLGEFFELLLDAGYKQTAGQFFTPLPIAKFIVSSLPIREIIQAKIEQKQADFLPLLIDYACGSGHFLVEAIEEIQEAVDELKPDFGDETNNRIQQWQATDWTKGFLYGIEKDYRLARTAKLACFMNGDGETNIILGDGLEDYSQIDPSFPASFDILVANPPYSIKDFKSHTLKSLKQNSFNLMNHLSESASEIEVLFVERLAQLLHTNGVCGVILPISILSNKGIYTKAREVLLRNFEIRAIVELGANTFMATGTNTATLFLKKRDSKTAINADYVADDFIAHNRERENDFADTLNILADYARTLGITLADYKSFLSRKPNETVLKSDWYKDYRRWFEKLTDTKKLRRNRKFLAKPEAEQAEIIEHRFFAEVKAKEKDKFEFFFLVYGQKTLIVRAHSDKKQRKRFLGYEFSKKRGAEGIKLYKQNGKHQTALYDEDDLNNAEKLNFLARQMLLPELYDYQSNNFIKPSPLPDFLVKQARVIDLTDCLDFSRVEFEKQISLSIKKTARQSKWDLVRLGEVAEIYNGGTPDTNKPEYWDGGIAWATLIDTKNKYLYSTQRTISAEGVRNSNAVLLPVNTVIFSSRATIGEVTIAKIEVSTNQGYKNFVCNPDLIKYEYLYLILKQEAESIADLDPGLTYPEISKDQIANYKIPLPPINVQDVILKEIEPIEVAEEQAKKRIEEKREEIDNIFRSSLGKNVPKVKLESVAVLEYGSALPENQRINGEFPVMGSNGVVGFHNEPLVDAPAIIVGRKGSAGKINYVEKACYPIDTTFWVKFHNGEVNARFFYYLLLSLNLEDIATGKGVGVPGLNRNDVHILNIPLPSIKEQNRIVARIVPLEKQISEAEQKLSKAAEKKSAILRRHL
jgi:type I restriction enzyme M protein